MGDNGRDELSSIEILQFDDATIVLGEDSPTVFEMDAVHYVTVGEEIDLTFHIRDWDNRYSITFESSEPDVGRLSHSRDANMGIMNMEADYFLTFDSGASYYGRRDLTYLAEGEELTITYTVVVDYELEERTQEFFFDVVIVGVNEAPEFSGAAALEVVEKGTDTSIDLSQFASDIDSDDDASTLTYEIVSAPEGFDISLDGSVLTYSVSTIDSRMTSDEVLEGEVVFRVVDRHGAASAETVTVTLTAQGADGPDTPIYVTPDGVDYAGLGVDPDAGPNLGLLQASRLLDGPELRALLDFTDGDDVRVIEAEAILGFSDRYNLDDADGNEIISGLGFDTGAGDDVFILNIDAAGNAIAQSTGISTGTGEDVVVITATGGTVQGVVDVDIDTGMNSDQVWVGIAAPGQMWFSGSIGTGSGHDIVEMHFTNLDYASYTDAFYAGSVSLGSGDDSFRLTFDATRSVFQGEIDGSVYAGDGNDYVYISNSAVEQVFVEGLIYTGGYAALYNFGMSGTVDMGAGDDVLDIDLNDAFQPGTTGRIDGGDGYDILTLQHLLAEDVTVTETATGYRIEDGNQILLVDGFEEIWFADDTPLV
ncbi:hypothetical protein [Ovoidimarina sediminis]|uniref:hypothetical protein n=1 Tax=Ovoidimarina sediminis TaxID=3079856 RepID=UPI00290E2E26|nr:hypothetical protein [Rhodophyticola sp. MJ-SS7]MDU8944434.1 hypothetical protein [Rhodophyticola sp. MJ-SS7]